MTYLHYAGKTKLYVKAGGAYHSVTVLYSTGSS